MICELRQEGYDDSYSLAESGRAYIFCSTDKLGVCNKGDHIFCINRSSGRAFYTIAIGKPLSTRIIAGNPCFTYRKVCYKTRKAGRIQPLKVISEQPLPDGWTWTKPLGLNNKYDLWREDIDRISQRLDKINDLSGIFTACMGARLLQCCREQLQQKTEDMKVTVYEDTIEMLTKPLTSFEQEYRQLLLACKTRPFVILSGPSGVGKSRLVRTLAHKTCSDAALRTELLPGNFILISVRPDWQDAADLLGYEVHQSGKYSSTDFIRFLVKAWRYPHVSFWVCLDEMNLARAEYYFADFLSVMETRHEGRTAALISATAVSQSWQELGLEKEEALLQQFLEQGIGIPPNLVVAGTVNMDDTTHAFSNRMLDRAMVIEMRDIDLYRGLTADTHDWQYPDLYISGMLLDNILPDVKTAWLQYTDCCRQVLQALSPFYNVFKGLSYRLRDEALLYCVYNHSIGQPLLESLDEIIMMKILPRIKGGPAACSTLIRSLLHLTQHRYPKSYIKLECMDLILAETGYISYWH